MRQRITSKATVDSSDENGGTAAGLVDEDSDSDSSEISSSSEGEEGGLLADAIDKILDGKVKAKGKQKRKAGGAKQAESECPVPYISMPFSQASPQRKLWLLETKWIVKQRRNSVLYCPHIFHVDSTWNGVHSTWNGIHSTWNGIMLEPSRIQLGIAWTLR